jgi:hypothetical protein
MAQKASGYLTEHNHFYPTPPWPTQALLRHIDVNKVTVWEPAAGDHRMADVLRHDGATVMTSDICRYGPAHNLIFDFLQGDWVAPWHVDCIITNPPYGAGNRLAQRFVELALQRCAGTVAMLLTANFDSAKTRHHLFRDCPRFSKKIVLVDHIRFFDRPGSMDGSTDHAWFVWRSVTWSPPTLAYEGKKP